MGIRSFLAGLFGGSQNAESPDHNALQILNQIATLFNRREFIVDLLEGTTHSARLEVSKGGKSFQIVCVIRSSVPQIIIAQKLSEYNVQEVFSFPLRPNTSLQMAVTTCETYVNATLPSQ